MQFSELMAVISTHAIRLQQEDEDLVILGSDDALDELQVEMIDRFGLLPEPVKNLFAVSALKLKAQALGIKKIDAGPNGGRLEFSNDTTVDPRRLIQLIQKEPKRYKLEGGDTLRFTDTMNVNETRLKFVHALLDGLTA